MTTPAGSVSAIRRHPVESMQGELLDGTWIDGRGVPGDRAYGVLDRWPSTSPLRIDSVVTT